MKKRFTEEELIDFKKKTLLESLQPLQREALKALGWFFYGPRGAGKTHLVCTLAILEVLDGKEGMVIDHTPSNYPMQSYVKHVLFSIAASIDLKIKIRTQGNAYFVSLADKNHLTSP